MVSNWGLGVFLSLNALVPHHCLGGERAPIDFLLSGSSHWGRRALFKGLLLNGSGLGRGGEPAKCLSVPMETWVFSTRLMGCVFFVVVVPSCIRCGFAWCPFSSTSCHLNPSNLLYFLTLFLSSRGGREAGRGLLRHNIVDLNLLGSFREPGLCACVYMYISVSKTST